MGRIVYLNGDYLPEDRARISVFDRGFLFADAVYEVTAVIDGKLIDFDSHFARLERSLAALKMALPMERGAFLDIFRELVTRNGLNEGLVYLQITRGNPDDRSFHFPAPDLPPTCLLFTQEIASISRPEVEVGIRVITLPDLRWHRRDIKTVQLLYPSMATMAAVEAGADDAWLVEDGHVTEGTCNNAHIVKNGRLITRGLSNDILHGTTRAAFLRLARALQIEVVERAFTVAEAQAADEAFITSATNFATPVINIDGVTVGSGRPGPVTARLREAYLAEVLGNAN